MALTKRIVELSGPPLIAITGACLLQTLPNGLLDFLSAWTLVSVPLGMMIGHCALSEG
jgi:hypothetical protein